MFSRLNTLFPPLLISSLPTGCITSTGSLDLWADLNEPIVLRPDLLSFKYYGFCFRFNGFSENLVVAIELHALYIK